MPALPRQREPEPRVRNSPQLLGPCEDEAISMHAYARRVIEFVPFNQSQLTLALIQNDMLICQVSNQ